MARNCDICRFCEDGAGCTNNKRACSEANDYEAFELDPRKVPVDPQPVQCWKCKACGKLTQKEDDFVFIVGNINKGRTGGLIGNNFDSEGKICRILVYCPECLKKCIDEYFTF